MGLQPATPSLASCLSRSATTLAFGSGRDALGGLAAFNKGNRSKPVTLQGWPQRMADWMNDSGFIAPGTAAGKSLSREKEHDHVARCDYVGETKLRRNLIESPVVVRRSRVREFQIAKSADLVCRHRQPVHEICGSLHDVVGSRLSVIP